MSFDSLGSYGYQSHPKPSPGRLLVASPRLLDENFKKAVVLICEHNEEGSMGLVMNRPLDLSTQELINGVGESEGFGAKDPGAHLSPVYLGGPVDPRRLLAIRHTMAIEAWEDDHSLLEGVALVSDVRGALRSIAEGDLNGSQFRFVLGYSGWGEGQLQDELKSAWWVITDATPELLFGTSPQHMWEEALKTISEGGSDPSLN